LGARCSVPGASCGAWCSVPCAAPGTWHEAPHQAPGTKHEAPDAYHSTMRYLRMLSNSLVAGSMAAAWLVVLFLSLNPALPLVQGASWGLIATIWAGYGVNFSAIFYALIVAQQLLVAEASSPGW